jgi:hypothetical protein
MARRDERIVGPQSHSPVTGVAGEADRGRDQTRAERLAASGRVDEQDPQLARARAEEIELPALGSAGAGLSAAALGVWAWLASDHHRGLLRLWVESYARSLIEPDGPWGPFARETVEDWLALLAAAQPAPARDSDAGLIERTLALAVLRGALLDLLATDDRERTTRAVQRALSPDGSAPGLPLLGIKRAIWPLRYPAGDEDAWREVSRRS